MKAHKIVQESLAGIESIGQGHKLIVDESTSELDQLTTLVESNLSKFENENLDKLRIISKKIERQSLRNTEVSETSLKANADGAVPKRSNCKDPSIVTKHHPAFQKDFDHYEESLSRD